MDETNDMMKLIMRLMMRLMMRLVMRLVIAVASSEMQSNKYFLVTPQ